METTSVLYLSEALKQDTWNNSASNEAAVTVQLLLYHSLAMTHSFTEYHFVSLLTEQTQQTR